MVLSRGDYSLKNLYAGTWDPTSPRSFLTKAAGAVVALTTILFLFGIAQNRVLPRVNSFLGSATGGRVSTGQPVEVF